MGEHFVEFDRQDDGGQRSRPTAAHGIGHGHAHGGGLGDLLLVEVLHEALEILDGDTTTRPAAGHAGEVGGAEAEFGHARFHARGKESGAAGVGGDGKALDRRLRFVRLLDLGLGHAFLFRFIRGTGRHGARGLPVGSVFFRFEIAHALGISIGNFEVAERRADRIALPFHGAEFDQFATARCDYAHDCFVRLDLHDVVVAGNVVAGLGNEADNGRLGDGFAELRHEERNAGHKIYWVRS